jgi:hypothetical protein
MASPNVLRDFIREETRKCMEDPIYFMRKYVKIQHPNKGTIPFDLFPFQEDTLENFHDARFLLILKSRQLGITTLVAAYSLWSMIFHSDKNILIISIKQEVSKEIVTKVRFANDHLPSWLKVVAVEDNRLSLRLKNGSSIAATSSSSDAGRSKALSLLVLDEAAFIDCAADIWTSCYNTLSTGGRAIVLSTPNGVGNWFHKMWVDAEKNRNDFKTLRLPWNLHPERNQAWRDEQTKQLGEREANQECDCDFLTSGVNVIDLITLQHYEETMMRDPLEMSHGNALWTWEHEKSEKSYIISADVARGDGQDYSAAHVFDIDTLEQVAEFQGLLPTKDYGHLLVTLAVKYNDALLVVERENVGWAVLQQIIDEQYKNTFYSSNDLKVVDVYRQFTNKYNTGEVKPGFGTTISTRPLLISKLEAYFRERGVIIRSTRTLNELKTFIWHNGKAQAAPNYNDDLVIALAIGLWIRDTALRLRSQGVLLSKSLLNGVYVEKPVQNSPIYVTKNLGNAENQWKMKTRRPGEDESLTWLLE